MQRLGFLLLLFATQGVAQAPTRTVAAQEGSAGGAAPRTVRAARAAGPVLVDGRFDEAAWATAEPAGDFLQRNPDPGAPATQRTEARVLYDEGAIYVGMRMFDARPDSIAAQLARRDAVGIYSDWAHVVIDSYHDRRTAFRFSVNPRGVLKDAYHFNDNNEDVSWDAVWEVATTVDSLGWTAEYRIPLSQLRYNAGAAGERVWGITFQRDLARREERSSWTRMLPTDPGFVSLLGDLRGLEEIRSTRRLELQPYASTRLTRAPDEAGNPFYRSNAAAVGAGLDVKLGLTSALTLTATINPDFGQVEVDPAVVNLSAFETFFEEKRPFFVEGSEIFRFGEVRSFNNYQFEQFFYSRRIGRAPQRSLSGDAVAHSDSPDQSTILGAAKVSGKTADGWTLGVMDAVTAEETGRFATAAGERGRSPVEPLTNYLVGRVRKDLRGGSTVVGGMLTATTRALGDSVFTDLLRSDAYLGGVDFEHSWAKRVWTVSGFLAGSRVQGSRAAVESLQRTSARYFQRPDADYLALDAQRTRLGGYMGEIALNRSGDWDLSVDYKESSPGFEINDMGFHGRTDYRALSTFLGRRVTKPGRVLRQFSQYVYANHAWNFGGDDIYHGYGLGLNGTFTSLWNAGLSLNANPEFTSDRLTRGGPLALSPAGWEAELFVGSDTRQRLSVEAGVGYGRTATGSESYEVGVGVDVRPSSTLRLRLEPGVERSLAREQFVTGVDDALAAATFGRRYVFADLDQTTVSMDTRVDWTFSPTLSLQLFAQPFVAAGDFRDYKEFLTPGALDFAVYGRDRGTAQGRTIDPDGDGPAASFEIADGSSTRDFTLRSLRGNAVLRWEYRPGSSLFFVWQQSRSGDEALGDFALRRDSGALLREPAENVFLVKATYWLGS